MSHVSRSVFWFVGLSGSGKTTLSKLIAQRLRLEGSNCLLLDGDELRSGLCRDLGFTVAARSENIRRAAELAKLACQQDLVVIAGFITPEESMRQLARDVVSPLPFFEIYLDCDYATCKKRDVKGLYSRADAGTVLNFTGRDATFEPPGAADLKVNTQSQSIENCLNQILAFIKKSS